MLVPSSKRRYAMTKIQRGSCAPHATATTPAPKGNLQGRSVIRKYGSPIKAAVLLLLSLAAVTHARAVEKRCDVTPTVPNGCDFIRIDPYVSSDPALHKLPLCRIETSCMTADKKRNVKTEIVSEELLIQDASWQVKSQIAVIFVFAIAVIGMWVAHQFNPQARME